MLDNILREMGGLGQRIDSSQLRTFQHMPNQDDRGEFTRIFDTTYLTDLLNRKVEFTQISMSFNTSKGTRRGLHIRRLPEVEYKFVRAIKGSFIDVILDCRPDSKSFGSWAMFELNARDGTGIVVPGGFAHGIQTLENDTTIVYGMEIEFSAQADIAINSNDSDLGIRWRRDAVCISEKDKNAMSWQSYKKSVFFSEV